jgi:hypothetical protein
MIKKAAVRINDYEQIRSEIEILIDYAQKPDALELVVRQMKRIVPEFTSKNSAYEELDHY